MQSTGDFTDVVNKIGGSIVAKFSLTGPKKTNITARALKNIFEVFYLRHNKPMLDENSRKLKHTTRAGMSHKPESKFTLKRAEDSHTEFVYCFKTA